MASLLILPDELKIQIFKYLNGVDKIELLKVCKDLHRVGVDRDVLQSLNFSNNYKLSLPQLRYIARKQTVSKVLKINLNGVHWIPSAQLRDTLSKFLNLTALYVLDTQLSYRDLVKISESTTKVRKLAFSMKPDNCADVFKVKMTLPVTHLFVTYNSYSIRALMTLLTQFSQLDELWIVEPKRPVKIKVQDEVPWLNYIENPLPKVSKKIVLSRQHTTVPAGMMFLNALKDRTKNWNCLINFNTEDTVFYVLEDKNLSRDKSCDIDCTKVSKGATEVQTKETEEEKKKMVVSSVRGVNILPAIPENLTDPWIYSKEARKTRKMKCDSNIFWCKPEEQTVEETALFKKRRIGTGSEKGGENCKFALFTKNVTEMSEFEIHDNDNRGVKDKLWHIENLSYIQNWKILKKLTISSVNIQSGKFLIDITKNCPMLYSLKIQDDFFQDNLTNNLCDALEYATNLKDFRYERKGGVSVDQLFESLTNCTKLERLYLQCRFASKISKKPLETVIARCENLVFLFIFITELHETVCKTIKQSINEFGVKPQQIISIRGQSYDLKNIMYEDIPACHIEEIVCQEGDFNCNYMQTFFKY